ncbi:MAG: hypothetical protein K0Q52_2400 [Microbacterium sp.]|nr:hypothetical protein [Microbacterium sp.]
MTKQLVNVIGAAASLAILLLGIVVVALPMFSGASATWASADDVADQNRTQQTVLDTLTAQAADMTQLDATVTELRAEIPPAAYLDDVLLLAVEAARAHGGTVTSIAPGTVEPFAPRVTVGEDETAAPAPDAAAEETPAPDATTPPAEDAAASVEPAEADAQQISVTLGVEAADVAAATRILDDLRAGPRLAAVTQATVTSDGEEGATLSVTLLTFTRR